MTLVWRIAFSHGVASCVAITSSGAYCCHGRCNPMNLLQILASAFTALHFTKHKKQKCKGKAAANMNFTSKQSQGCKTRIGQKGPSKSQKWLKCLSKGQQGQTKGRQRCKEGNLHKIAPITISQICNQNW